MNPELSVFLVGLFLGLFTGFILTLNTFAPRRDDETATNEKPAITELLAEQIQFNQLQNMLRAVQLEQAKQQLELSTLEEQRTKYLGNVNRLNHADIRLALSSLAGGAQ